MAVQAKTGCTMAGPDDAKHDNGNVLVATTMATMILAMATVVVLTAIMLVMMTTLAIDFSKNT